MSTTFTLHYQWKWRDCCCFCDKNNVDKFFLFLFLFHNLTVFGFEPCTSFELFNLFCLLLFTNFITKYVTGKIQQRQQLMSWNQIAIAPHPTSNINSSFQEPGLLRSIFGGKTVEIKVDGTRHETKGFIAHIVGDEEGLIRGFLWFIFINEKKAIN